MSKHRTDNNELVKANYKRSTPIYPIGETIHVPNLPEPQRITGIVSYRIVRGRIVVMYRTENAARYIAPTPHLGGESTFIQWSHALDQQEQLEGLESGSFIHLANHWYQIEELRSLRVESDRLVVSGSAWIVSKELVEERAG